VEKGEAAQVKDIDSDCADVDHVGADCMQGEVSGNWAGRWLLLLGRRVK